MHEEWYRSWFDTPYYNLLYQHRDESEARFFIDHLIRFLDLQPGAKILDLACGRGRHAVYLNALGYDVTGLDLSRTRIAQAQAYANDKLHFVVGDMRELPFDESFDLALNLFTSIGYFPDQDENQQVFHSLRHCLKLEGKLIIDFLNAEQVEHSLVPFEEHEVDGVQFEIRRCIKRDTVEKRIRVRDGVKILHFTESVQLLHRKDFERMLRREHFHITELWGDYSGAPFQPNSRRLILFAQRIS